MVDNLAGKVDECPLNRGRWVLFAYYGANFGQKINCCFGQWYFINDRPIMRIDRFYRPKLLIDRFYRPKLLIDRFYWPMLTISMNFIDQWYPSGYTPSIVKKNKNYTSFPGPAQHKRRKAGRGLGTRLETTPKSGSIPTGSRKWKRNTLWRSGNLSSELDSR